MAFYNPQRVVFNPDKMVIQNAGKVGGVLYDMMKQNYDDKIKAHQFKQEMDLKQQEMDFNQALKNNQIMQNERDFDYKKEQDKIKFDFEKQKQAQDNALAWAKYNLDKDYKNKYLDYLADKNTSNSDNIANHELYLPNFLESDKDLQIIDQRLKDIEAAGSTDYYDSQGLFDGTWENMKGLVGKFNANKEQDNVFNMMSDYIYRTKVRRDTNYNRQRHDEIYEKPSAYAPQTVNAQRQARAAKDFLAAVEATINDNYDQQLAKASNLKNPYINTHYEEKRQKELETFEKEFAKRFRRMYLNEKNNTSLSQGQRIPLKEILAQQPQQAQQSLTQQQQQAQQQLTQKELEKMKIITFK